MAASVPLSPIKVDEATNALATHGAHFLGLTKKEFVARAIRFYAEAKQAEIEEGVGEALAVLDSSRESAIALLSGLSPERIEELGGLG
jgi:hypothetical protein